MMKLITLGIGAFLLAATVLPLIKGEAWWIRVFDFPRLQIAALLVVVAVVHAMLSGRSAGDWLFIAILMLACLVQGYQIYPYTPLAKVQSVSVRQSKPADLITFVTVNVLQSNREADKLIAIIRSANPDIVLAVETDDWWLERLRILENDYPHVLRCPLPNTYGLYFLSRLPLRKAEIRMLIDDSIPSVYAQVQLRSGAVIDLFGLHPEPPHPIDNANTAKRDAELVLIAREAHRSSKPAVVIGDLNDVAWSHTTRLFQRISGMLDPRVGRGMFNTFPATVPFMRFPIDHVFHTPEFQLVELKRLPKFGSDHFPMYASLCYVPDDSARQQLPEQPDREDIEESEEKLDKAGS